MKELEFRIYQIFTVAVTGLALGTFIYALTLMGN